MDDRLKVKNNIPSNFGIMKARENLSQPFSSENIDNDADLLGELESIEKEMLNGEGIPFKDVNDLAKRYEL